MSGQWPTQQINNAPVNWIKSKARRIESIWVFPESGSFSIDDYFKWWRHVFACGSSSDVTLLAGIIVLEEFCKELAAIAFIKHYAETTWHLALVSSYVTALGRLLSVANSLGSGSHPLLVLFFIEMNTVLPCCIWLLHVTCYEYSCWIVVSNCSQCEWVLTL